MTEETPKDDGVKDPVSPGGETQDEPNSEEYVSMAEFKSLGESLVKTIEEASKRNRQSQADVIKHEVGETLDGALKDLSASFQPKESEPAPEPESEPPTEGEPPADPQPSFGLEAEIKGLLDKHGLKAETPELVTYVKEHAGEPWFEAGPGFAALAEELGAREAGAIQASPGAGAAPRPDLEQEYIGKVQELREQVQMGKVKRYAAQIANDSIRNEYFGKGVDVDSIVFNLDGSTGKQRQEDLA